MMVPGTAVQRVTRADSISAFVPAGTEWQKMHGNIDLKKWFRMEPSSLQQSHRKGCSVKIPSWYLTNMVSSQNVTAWDSSPAMGRTWYNSTVTFQIPHGATCSNNLAKQINLSWFKPDPWLSHIHGVNFSCGDPSHVPLGSHPAPLCSISFKLEKHVCTTLATNRYDKSMYCPDHYRVHADKKRETRETTRARKMKLRTTHPAEKMQGSEDDA
jgi:hypothetical protein